MRHPLFVISGPAACGKIELVGRILQIFPELVSVTTYTTRKPRPGESPDRAYTFISDEEFNCAKQKGLLVEFSLTHGHYHGTAKTQLYDALEKGPAIIIRDPEGADKLAALIPEAHFAFILAPESEIRERMKRRSRTIDELTARMQDARNDALAAMHPQYDCIINNANAKADRSARLLIRFLMETLG
jgi:guanylate kinase